jgi:malonyl-CoA/methylmalonyl-CoA synthetase
MILCITETYKVTNISLSPVSISIQKMLFVKKITANTQRTPDKLALQFLDPPEQQVTYAELEAGIRLCMGHLAGLGLQPGDRIALQLPKGLEFIQLHLAALRLGAITLPLNTAYPPAELVYFLKDSGAHLFFTDTTRQEALKDISIDLPALEQVIYIDVETPAEFSTLLTRNPLVYSPYLEFHHQPDTTVLMVYTSGTTGRPKGAEITAGNVTANLEALHAAWGWEREDVLLHALPIFHVHGLVVALYGALFAGASCLAFRKFDARRTLETLSSGEPTLFMGVPTIYQRLLALPDAGEFDLSSMRLLTSGSDRLPNETFLAFQETFGHTLLERYGMTETGMNLSNPLHGERRMGSVGLPLPGVEARIVDPETEVPLSDGDIGAVQIRGPHVFKGYWRQPDKTAAAFNPDGWLRTGDMGLRAPDGYFTLKGRAKDLIITGGLNVYPPEVERVLAEHPAVTASAVLGCPDPEWGENVVAVVVLESRKTVAEPALIDFCRARLAAYKCPKAVHSVAALPRNAMGKVQKGELREKFCGR